MQLTKTAPNIVNTYESWRRQRRQRATKNKREFCFKSVDKFHNEISQDKVGSSFYAYPRRQSKLGPTNLLQPPWRKLLANLYEYWLQLPDGNDGHADLWPLSLFADWVSILSMFGSICHSFYPHRPHQPPTYPLSALRPCWNQTFAPFRMSSIGFHHSPRQSQQILAVLPANLKRHKRLSSFIFPFFFLQNCIQNKLNSYHSERCDEYSCGSADA